MLGIVNDQINQRRGSTCWINWLEFLFAFLFYVFLSRFESKRFILCKQAPLHF